MFNRKRYRFRSTSYDNVRWWLNTMIEKYSDYDNNIKTQ